jgi:hypothetical protein
MCLIYFEAMLPDLIFEGKKKFLKDFFDNLQRCQISYGLPKILKYQQKFIVAKFSCKQTLKPKKIIKNPKKVNSPSVFPRNKFTFSKLTQKKEVN